MTVLPEPPARLLTVAEYTRLGETSTGYTELQQGHLIMSPSSSPRHMIASGRLLGQVQSQLSDELCAVQEVDIDLELIPADQPGVVRRPDLVVVDYTAIDRVDRDGGLLALLTPVSGTTGSWTSMSRLRCLIATSAAHLASSTVAVSPAPSPPPHHFRSTWNSAGYCGESIAGAIVVVRIATPATMSQPGDTQYIRSWIITHIRGDGVLRGRMVPLESATGCRSCAIASPRYAAGNSATGCAGPSSRPD